MDKNRKHSWLLKAQKMGFVDLYCEIKDCYHSLVKEICLYNKKPFCRTLHNKSLVFLKLLVLKVLIGFSLIAELKPVS